jgi:hypothetical protein
MAISWMKTRLACENALATGWIADEAQMLDHQLTLASQQALARNAPH